MKIRIALLLFFVASYTFAQSVNDYKAVIVPLKFDFLKSENQYRLATISKYELGKSGFKAYYDAEPIQDEIIERCELLNFDVIKESSFLTTKLYIVFKDCYGKIVFQSETGVSREKDYEVAYKDALDKAFVSVYALHYKYSGKTKTAMTAKPTATIKKEIVIASAESVRTGKASASLLYAQPTAAGFQLVDSTPSVVMNVYKTSINECYIALKGDQQGVLIAKDNQWLFEFYQNDNLISEEIEVKF